MGCTPDQTRSNYTFLLPPRGNRSILLTHTAILQPSWQQHTCQSWWNRYIHRWHTGYLQNACQSLQMQKPSTGLAHCTHILYSPYSPSCSAKTSQCHCLTEHTFCTALSPSCWAKTSQCNRLTEYTFCTALTVQAVGQKQVSAIGSLNTHSVQSLLPQLLGKNKSVRSAHWTHFLYSPYSPSCWVKISQCHWLTHCTHVLYSPYRPSCWAKTSQCDRLIVHTFCTAAVGQKQASARNCDPNWTKRSVTGTS